MTKIKPPKETNQLAKFIVDIATGEQKKQKQKASKKISLPEKNDK